MARRRHDGSPVFRRAALVHADPSHARVDRSATWRLLALPIKKSTKIILGFCAYLAVLAYGVALISQDINRIILSPGRVVRNPADGTPERSPEAPPPPLMEGATPWVSPPAPEEVTPQNAPVPEKQGVSAPPAESKSPTTGHRGSAGAKRARGSTH